MTESLQGGNYDALAKYHVDATLTMMPTMFMDSGGVCNGGLCLFSIQYFIDLKALPPHCRYLQCKQARNQGVYIPLPETAAIQIKTEISLLMKNKEAQVEKEKKMYKKDRL